MKKLIALITALASVLALAGCSRSAVGPGRPVAPYIGDYVTRIEVEHYLAGQSTQWTAEGKEVEAVRAWADGLKYKIYEYEEGQSPGDSDGGEVYDFVLTEGAYPGFSYVINGPEDCYLLIEGYWYSVSNPSDPPVQEK